MATFCSKCGQPVEDGIAFCANCGTPVQAAAPQQPQFQQPQFQQPQFQQAPQMGGQAPKHPKTTLATLMGVAGLVLGTLGAILFGVIAAAIGLALGVVGAIFAVTIKKETNNTQGGGVMVLAILAIVFGAVFAIGCLACGYGVYGWATISCAVKSAMSDFESELSSALSGWY